MKININQLPEVQRKRHQYCNRRLTDLWENNAEFIKGYRAAFNYYIGKANSLIKGRTNRNEFQKRFLHYMNDLFYQGYYMGLELLEHPEVVIEDHFFTQPNGLVKEQTYDILQGATTNLYESLSHDSNKIFEKEIEDSYPSLKKDLIQAKIEIGCSGAYQAFLDEREKRKVFIRQEPPQIIQGAIARSDDYLFVDPHKYLACVSVSEANEVWELYHWAGIETRNKKIGEVLVNVLDKDSANEMYKHLPIYQGYESISTESSKYNLTLFLDEKTQEYERLQITGVIVESLTNRKKLNYTDVNVSLIISSEYYSYEYKPTKD